MGPAARRVGLLTLALIVAGSIEQGLYRVTLNFTDLPYSSHLKDVTSKEFSRTSQHVAVGLHSLFDSLPGDEGVTIVDYQ